MALNDVNCLFFSCSAIFVSKKGAVSLLVIKNFSYSVLENLFQQHHLLSEYGFSNLIIIIN